MARSFEGRMVHEFENVDGIINFVEAKKGDISCDRTPIHNIPKERTDIWDCYSALSWELPEKITPYQDGQGLQINHDDPDSICKFLSDISREILMILEECMYFKDDRYPAIILNFIMNTYFKEAFDFAPRIILTGATDSGKSRLLEILNELCYHSSYMIRPTFAVLFRMIEAYNVTPIIDEAQRLTREAHADLEDIFLSGTKKNGHINRCNNNSLKPENFKIYSPMAMSIKTGTFTAEDVESRAFTINLIPNRTKKIAAKLDKEKLSRIRTELYSIYALYKLHPKSFNFNELIDRSIYELTKSDKEGNMIIDYLINERIRLKNRSLDIAITYYTLAKITGTDHEILSILNEEDKNNSERLKDTLEGEVFRSYINCCENLAETEPLLGYLDIMTSVSSTKIAERINLNRQESGNMMSNLDRISSNKACRVMDGLSLEMARGIGFSKNNESVVKRVKKLEEYIDINEDRFATEKESKILEKLRKKKPKQKLTSKLMEKQKLIEN